MLLASAGRKLEAGAQFTALLALLVQKHPPFTCFPSTKVQILTQQAGSWKQVLSLLALLALLVPKHPPFTCFPGTKVQILTQQAGKLEAGAQFTCFTSAKSTNTDAAGAQSSVYLLS